MLAGVTLMVAGCGHSGSSIAAPAVTASFCGFRHGPVAVDKVLVIFEENHDYGSVVGSPHAPNLNRVASGCGLATHYEALTHPSLPNYLTAVSGQDYARSPFDGDCTPGGSCLINGPSIFGQEVAAGHTWRSYQEAMPAACDRFVCAEAQPRGLRRRRPVHLPVVRFAAGNGQLRGPGRRRRGGNTAVVLDPHPRPRP